MDKLTIVEDYFKHENVNVFYDEVEDNIYVCFGEIEFRSDNEMAFLDCRIAEIEDDVEYNGELSDKKYDVAFLLPKEDIEFAKKGYIPTSFGEGELLDVVKNN